jgi:ribose/xylose/arabinose/galactoside ABC-type transport system permease subunit
MTSTPLRSEETSPRRRGQLRALASELVVRMNVMIRDFGLLIGMVGVLLCLGALQPDILTVGNISSVMDSASSLVVMSVGLAIVMKMRGVDLSIAQVAEASGLLAALMLLNGQPMFLVLAVPLIFAALVGLANGVIMAYLGVPAIVGTLGMMFVVRSIELVVSNGGEAKVLFTLPAGQTAPFFFIGQGTIGPISTPVVLAGCVVAGGHFLTKSTTFGRYVDAIGGNVRAAFLAGVRHRLVFAGGFIVSALAAAVAGLLLTSRGAMAQPGAYETYLVDCFVAVYLGMALTPRRTINVVGTAVGAVFVGFIGNALTLMGFGAAYHYVIYGLIILVAMTIGALRSQGTEAS